MDRGGGLYQQTHTASTTAVAVENGATGDKNVPPRYTLEDSKHPKLAMLGYFAATGCKIHELSGWLSFNWINAAAMW